MADRNSYMREYMREYRAAKKAARLVETGGASGPALAIVKSGGAPGDTIPAASSTSSTVTEPGQVLTEPGIYARYKWAWWLLAGLVVGYGLYLVTNGEEPRKHLDYPVPVELSTEPDNPENTAPGQDETPDDFTEPGQE